MTATISVVVEFFKPSGKWYTSEAVPFPTGIEPWNARKVIEDHLAGRLRGMSAVLCSHAAEKLWGYPLQVHKLGEDGL